MQQSIEDPWGVRGTLDPVREYVRAHRCSWELPRCENFFHPYTVKQMTDEELATQRLCQEYPWLDEMMATTLLKMSAQGKLEQYMSKLPEPGPPTQEVIVGAITVEDPEEKSSP